MGKEIGMGMGVGVVMGMDICLVFASWGQGIG